MPGKLRYSSNNSGGSWWLNDDDWKNLEAAGWTVEWFEDQTGAFRHGERFLGGLAQNASKTVESPAEGVEEWERITSQTASDQGCNCCGAPHSFSFDDETSGKTAYLDHEYGAVSTSWSTW